MGLATSEGARGYLGDLDQPGTTTHHSGCRKPIHGEIGYSHPQNGAYIEAQQVTLPQDNFL